MRSSGGESEANILLFFFNPLKERTCNPSFPKGRAVEFNDKVVISLGNQGMLPPFFFFFNLSVLVCCSVSKTAEVASPGQPTLGRNFKNGIQNILPIVRQL